MNKIIGSSAAEIFDSIRTLVQTGSLSPGQALPTVRDLAVQLEVNRNTVSMAYKRLVSAGVAITQGRLGTVIRPQPAAGEQEGSHPGSPLIDLGSGNPNPDWLPDLGAALARTPYHTPLYGESPVSPALESLGRQWFEPDCPQPFALNLTHGSIDAVERLLSAYLVAGDKVIVEDPCFLSSINALRIAGFQTIGVPVDAQGLCVQALEQALAQGVQALIITPRAHNPTGCSLSRVRAKKIQALLSRYPQVLVIVDDHFSCLAMAEYHNVIARSSLRWALIRTVSKMFGPDLRLALVASDEQTSQRLRLRLAPGTHWVSHLLQSAIQGFLASSEVIAQLEQARQDYARRRAILAAALTMQQIDYTTPADGLNLWLPLQQSSQAVVLKLAQRGWLVRGGDAFGVQTPAHGLRVTIAKMDEATAQAFAIALREILV